MDRDELLASMYQDEDDSPPPKPIERSDLRSRMIRVGAIGYEVPTVDYIRHLENVIQQQANRMDHLSREIDRLHSNLFGTRNFLRRQTVTIADLRAQVFQRRFEP